MKKIIFYVLLTFICLSSLAANGGIHWWENGTGTSEPATITLKNDSDIVLKKENLTLRFIENSVIVSCDYILLNKNSSDKIIDFAFNITEGAHPALHYYDIFVDGTKLDSDLHTEKNDYDGDGIFTSYWELSKIKLNAKKETNVSICYRVDTENDGKYYASYFNDNSFIYNLFPALSFGDGIIEDFNLTIDASDIIGWNGEITKIDGIDISFNRSERIISKSFKNFDLSKHKQLKISYNIKNYYFASLYSNYGLRFFFNGISASSELKEGSTTYSAFNLVDNNCKTAWVEGKSDFGKNEKIKISASGNFTQILLVNGFRKSEKTYYENNRVKKIALYIDGVRLGEITFPDRPYHQVNMTNILDEGELLNLNEDLFKNKSAKTWNNARSFFSDKNIEIEILEVYPGTKYNDTCISDIYLIKADLPIS